MVIRYTLLSLSIFVAACGLSSDEKALLGKWQNEDRPQDIIEFFDDKTANFEDVPIGSATAKWTILNDGRIKIDASYLGMTVIIIAKRDGDALVFIDDNSKYRRMK